MKLNYFRHWLESIIGEKQMWHLPLYKILHNFCIVQDKEFRNSFRYCGDQVFLVRRSDRLFLFLIVRDSEIIKAINSIDMNVEDICNRLEANEMLGFASYVYVEEDFYAIATTLHGPRNIAFLTFISDLLSRLEVAQVAPQVCPLPTKASREEALKMEFVGKITIAVDPRGTFMRQLRGIIGADVSSLEAMEVTITPKKKQDIKPTLEKIATFVGEDPAFVRKWIVRGRQEMEDSIQDYYINGDGFVSDFISNPNEQTLASVIAEKIKGNRLLHEKVKEHIDGVILEGDPLECVRNLVNLDSFRTVMGRAALRSPDLTAPRDTEQD